MKHIKKYNEQLSESESTSEPRNEDFHKAMELYSKGLDLLSEAGLLFQTSEMEIPEEFDNLFIGGQGNETMDNLISEVGYYFEK